MKTFFRRLLGITFLAAIVFALLDCTFECCPVPSWSQIVYDRNGKVLNVYLSKDDKWRIRCRPEQVDSLLLKTLLCKEDRYFYYHPGFNPAAIVRAAFNNVLKRQRTSGASTITMQVVRLLEPRERNIVSKCIEIFRAMQLEYHYTKNEILSLYLSLAPYGGNIEGVAAASLIYYGKPPALLSPAEAVTLTIIPNRPSSLRPGKENTFLFSERNRWLRQLHYEGIIPLSDLEEALTEPIEMQRRPLPFLAPHLSRRLIRANDAPEIYTTIDAAVQEKVSQLCYNHLKRLQNIGIENGAVLVIDNVKHTALAYVGSQDYSDPFYSGQVDGIRAIRSPGSTLKPLVYAMAFDAGHITPKTMLADVPVNYGSYSPENFDTRFHGLISAEDALSASMNIPAVTLLEKVGLPDFREHLLRAGCRSLASQNKLGLSAVLGGCGLTLEELCGLYSSFANQGSYIPLRYQRNGKADTTSAQIISTSAAYILSSILTKMNRSDLPFLFENSLHIPKVAWKTGTSYGRRDAWSIGYNRRYTVGVWIGNFDGHGAPELTGADMATPLLFQVFNTIDYNSTGDWYKPGPELDLRYVCPQSGNIPGDLCTEKIIDYYLPGISSVSTCTHLSEYNVDEKETIRYCTVCLPENGYKRKIYENPPAEILKYYRENNVPVKIPPPHDPNCSRLFAGNKPRILSLVADQEYLIEKDDRRSLELSCAVASDVAQVNWFINDTFFKTTKAGDKCFFQPHEGPVKISCTDDKGRNSDIYIRVLYY